MASNEVFVSQEQYDKLVWRYPAFMELEWSVGGVHVTASNEGWHHALQANLRGVS